MEKIYNACVNFLSDHKVPSSQDASFKQLVSGVQRFVSQVRPHTDYFVVRGTAEFKEKHLPVESLAVYRALAELAALFCTPRHSEASQCEAFAKILTAEDTAGWSSIVQAITQHQSADSAYSASLGNQSVSSLAKTRAHILNPAQASTFNGV